MDENKNEALEASQEPVESENEVHEDNKNGGSAMAIGMCLGAAIGAAIGSATGKMGLWMPIGLSIGMCLGLTIGSRNAGEKDDPDRKD